MKLEYKIENRIEQIEQFLETGAMDEKVGNVLINEFKQLLKIEAWEQD